MSRSGSSVARAQSPARLRVRESLSPAQARRVALAAQGFGGGRADLASGVRPLTMRAVQTAVDRLAQFQIDTINVVARAHYLPLYSRLGPYDPALLERAAYRAPRRLFEYWAHAASLIDVRLQPALRFRMARAEAEAWGRMRRVYAEHPDLVRQVLAEVGEHGPLTARQLDARLVRANPEVRVREHWGWNWSQTKTALEWLFWAGEVTSASRNAQFERVFDLPERVLPPEVSNAPTPDPQESVRILLRRAAAALGVGTLGCLADYFRLGQQETRQGINELVETGELLPVRIGDSSSHTPAWLWHQARIPRHVPTQALLSPFDSMVFERSRLRRLFGFDFRIEIYVPEPKRRHGYYVYPFLLDESFVARVDLKADRGAGELVVRAAWLEPGRDATRVSRALAAELALLGSWQGLERVRIEQRGDLARTLGDVVEAARPDSPRDVVG